MSGPPPDPWRVPALEKLGAELRRRERDAPAASDGRRALPRAAIIAATVIALSGAILAVLYSAAGPRATPAYAVSLNGDRSITLTLRELLGIRGANEDLSRLGVPVVIAGVEPSCRAHGQVLETSPQEHDIVEVTRVADGFEGLRWIIHPRAIPPGDTVQLSVAYPSDGTPAPVAIAGSWSLFRGRAPSCRVP